MNNKLYKLGIDIGSTTVKIAILNKDNDILFSDYERHFANIQDTLASLLLKAKELLGDIKVNPVITGSGGLPLLNIMLQKQMWLLNLVAKMLKLYILQMELTNV